MVPFLLLLLLGSARANARYKRSDYAGAYGHYRAALALLEAEAAWRAAPRATRGEAPAGAPPPTLRAHDRARLRCNCAKAALRLRRYSDARRESGAAVDLMGGDGYGKALAVRAECHLRLFDYARARPKPPVCFALPPPPWSNDP